MILLQLLPHEQPDRVPVNVRRNQMETARRQKRRAHRHSSRRIPVTRIRYPARHRARKIPVKEILRRRHVHPVTLIHRRVKLRMLTLQIIAHRIRKLQIPLVLPVQPILQLPDRLLRVPVPFHPRPVIRLLPVQYQLHRSAGRRLQILNPRTHVLPGRNQHHPLVPSASFFERFPRRFVNLVAKRFPPRCRRPRVVLLYLTLRSFPRNVRYLKHIPLLFLERLQLRGRILATQVKPDRLPGLVLRVNPEPLFRRADRIETPRLHPRFLQTRPHRFRQLNVVNPDVACNLFPVLQILKHLPAVLHTHPVRPLRTTHVPVRNLVILLPENRSVLYQRNPGILLFQSAVQKTSLLDNPLHAALILQCPVKPALHFVHPALLSARRILHQIHHLPRHALLQLKLVPGPRYPVKKTRQRHRFHQIIRHPVRFPVKITVRRNRLIPSAHLPDRRAPKRFNLFPPRKHLRTELLASRLDELFQHLARFLHKFRVLQPQRPEMIQIPDFTLRRFRFRLKLRLPVSSFRRFLRKLIQSLLRLRYPFPRVTLTLLHRLRVHPHNLRNPVQCRLTLPHRRIRHVLIRPLRPVRIQHLPDFSDRLLLRHLALIRYHRLAKTVELIRPPPVRICLAPLRTEPRQPDNPRYELVPESLVYIFIRKLLRRILNIPDVPPVLDNHLLERPQLLQIFSRKLRAPLLDSCRKRRHISFFLRQRRIQIRDVLRPSFPARSIFPEHPLVKKMVRLPVR